ncbi:MAG: hypothetical protein ABIH21_03325 [Patescibacteria group bacterium]
MTLTFIGFTLDVLGKLLIAVVTLRIHIKHFKKHRVDQKEIARDARLSIIGITMIAVGYILRVPYEYGL